MTTTQHLRGHGCPDPSADSGHGGGNSASNAPRTELSRTPNSCPGRADLLFLLRSEEKKKKKNILREPCEECHLSTSELAKLCTQNAKEEPPIRVSMSKSVGGTAGVVQAAAWRGGALLREEPRMLRGYPGDSVAARSRAEPPVIRVYRGRAGPR